MSLQCPKCSSFQIGDRNHARKVAGTLGTVAGCVGGVTAVVHGAELGAIIGIRLLFNDPDLNLRAEYSLFDRQNGRPLCVGNGELCRRATTEGVQSLPCPAPEGCQLAKAGCKPYGRLNVRIGDEDELGTFIFRTTGFNSIRTLAARLSYFHSVSGGLLACMPLELKLRGKSTTQSHRAAIFYADITVREGMTLEQAIAEARATHERRHSVGYDQEGLDQAARLGFQNAAFETSEEEVPEILEEFFPEDGGHSGQAADTAQTTSAKGRLSLKDKLDSRVTSIGQETAKVGSVA